MSKQSIKAGISSERAQHSHSDLQMQQYLRKRKQKLRGKNGEEGKDPSFPCDISPAAPLEEKLSICAPPELVVVADPRNEQEGGAGGEDAPAAAAKNTSRPASIASGDVRGS